MEVTANKQHGVSAFFRNERPTPSGVHVGFVCDARSELGAKIFTFYWASLKGVAPSKDLIRKIFYGVN